MGAAASSSVPDVIVGETASPPVTCIVVGMPGRGKSRFISHMLNLKIDSSGGKHGKKSYILWSTDLETVKDKWKLYFKEEFVSFTGATSAAEHNNMAGHTQHPQVHGVDDLHFMDTPGVEIGNWAQVAETMRSRIQNSEGPVRFVFFCGVDGETERVTQMDTIMIKKIIKNIDGVSTQDIAKSSVLVLNGFGRKVWKLWPSSSSVDILKKTFFGANNNLVRGVKMIFAEKPDEEPEVGLILKVTNFDESRPDGGLGQKILDKFNSVPPLVINDFNYDEEAMNEVLEVDEDALIGDENADDVNAGML